jgi:hypothetical protein
MKDQIARLRQHLAAVDWHAVARVALPGVIIAGLILANALLAVALVLLSAGDPRAPALTVAGLLVAALALGINQNVRRD